MSEDKEEPFGENAQAVQTHLAILQGVVQRMSANSASAKAWCVTLVSAILVVVADKNRPRFAWLALIPTILFLILDAYYLALERGFRESYSLFVQRLHRRTLTNADFYSIAPQGTLLPTVFVSMTSFSVWPFYLTLALMIYLSQRLIL